MFINASIRKALTGAKAALVLTLCALLLAFSESSREGVKTGLELCLRVLTPSLFPFMALTHLFVKTGLCGALGRPLSRPSKLLFGLNGALSAVLLLSLVGGYPVGASGIGSLRRQGAVDDRDAERAALFCVCAGPGFVLSFVGGAVYHSAAIGRAILFSQVLSVLITGCIARIIFPIKKNTARKEEPPVKALPFGQALAASVYAAAEGMLAICAYVLAFSSLAGILSALIADRAVLGACFTLLEVNTAVNALAPWAPVEQVAFAVGFGGLCVHLQIFAALGEVRVNRPLFFLFRIMQGALTAGFCHLILRQDRRAVAVFSTAGQAQGSLIGGSLLSGAALLAVILCFFISIKQTKNQ